MSALASPMSIRLSPLARQRLQFIAQRQKRSSHALATEAIEQLIEQKEREYAWQQSCDDALEHFDQTGLHVSHDEVKQWMSTWGAEKELPAPQAHL